MPADMYTFIKHGYPIPGTPREVWERADSIIEEYRDTDSWIEDSTAKYAKWLICYLYQNGIKYFELLQTPRAALIINFKVNEYALGQNDPHPILFSEYEGKITINYPVCDLLITFPDSEDKDEYIDAKDLYKPDLGGRLDKFFKMASKSATDLSKEWEGCEDFRSGPFPEYDGLSFSNAC